MIDQVKYEIHVAAPEQTPTIHHGTVELSSLASKLEFWLNKNELNLRGKDNSTLGTNVPANGEYTLIFLELLPEIQKTMGVGHSATLTNPSPLYGNSFELGETSDRRWAHIRLHQWQWIFFYRQVENGPYQWVQLPHICTINYRGSVEVKIGEKKMEVHARSDMWPWVLLDPASWLALSHLRKILQPDRENPLSGLLHTDHAAEQTLAYQLRRQIINLDHELTAALMK